MTTSDLSLVSFEVDLSRLDAELSMLTEVTPVSDNNNNNNNNDMTITITTVIVIVLTINT